MPKVPYTPESFPIHSGPLFSSTQDMEASWEEICWAALTVGRRNWADVLAQGTYSLLEALWRLALVRANLMETGNGRLARSAAYNSLDRSEKGAVSFFLGNVFAKLFCDKMLGVQWLLHLDVYRQLINPSLVLHNRPDFVGLDARRRWIVVEAKGRTSSVTRKLMQDAKLQTRCLRRINGDFPNLRVAIGTYFPSQYLRLRVVDPDGYEEDAVDLELSPEVLLETYYQPIVELFHSDFPQTQAPSEGQLFHSVRLPGFDTSVTISDEVFQAFVEHDSRALRQFIEKKEASPSIVRAIHDLKDEEHLISEVLDSVKEHTPFDSEELFSWKRLSARVEPGPDGIGIRLGPSWSRDEMSKEPRTRGSDKR